MADMAASVLARLKNKAMVWYPTEPEAENYLSRLLKNIESYRDENWLNKWPGE
jgi:hypothetical protein